MHALVLVTWMAFQICFIWESPTVTAQVHAKITTSDSTQQGYSADSVHVGFFFFITYSCWIVSKVFSASTEMTIFFYSSICWCGVLYWLICRYWKILVSLGWIPLDHDVWSFYCIVGYKLLALGWPFLLLCSSMIFVCNFFVCDICWIIEISVGSSKKQESSRKISTSALLTVPKPLTVWIKINWKILKEMGIPDHLTYLLRNLFAGQETTV